MTIRSLISRLTISGMVFQAGAIPGRAAILFGLLMLPVFLCAQGSAHAEVGSGSGAPPILLELFTSEGCSSCPAADALLQQLSGTRTAAGQAILVISEHVTYWNRLGWVDPYSADTFTERQNRYGDRFHLDSVYTPQLVVNGSAQVVGSERSDVDAAIQRQRAPTGVTLHVGRVNPGQTALTFPYTADGQIPSGGMDLYVALVDDSDESHVARGENAGRVLRHVSVARFLVKADHISGAHSGEVSVAMPQDLIRASGRGQHVVLFLQRPGLGPVLAAASAPVAAL
jgi:hypothetical protein